MFAVLQRLRELGRMVGRHELLGAIDKLELSLVDGEEYGRRRVYRITSLDVWRGVMVKRGKAIFVFRGKGMYRFSKWRRRVAVSTFIWCVTMSREVLY